MALNPQQQAFKEAYCNPSSPTFGNALQSGLKVGFSQEYSECITVQNTKWFSEILGDQEMLNLAEDALKEAMTYDVRNGGERVDSGIAAIKAKVAIFGAETLGKQKYSKRTETDITTGGEKINGDVEEKVTSALNDYFTARNTQ